MRYLLLFICTIILTGCVNNKDVSVSEDMAVDKGNAVNIESKIKTEEVKPEEKELKVSNQETTKEVPEMKTPPLKTDSGKFKYYESKELGYRVKLPAEWFNYDNFRVEFKYSKQGQDGHLNERWEDHYIADFDDWPSDGGSFTMLTIGSMNDIFWQDEIIYHGDCSYLNPGICSSNIITKWNENSIDNSTYYYYFSMQDTPEEYKNLVPWVNNIDANNYFEVLKK